MLLERLVVSSIVFLGAVSFACCVAAEFNKSKAKDMEVDGNLCSLPRSSAFGLGIAAIVCNSIVQIAGTSMATAIWFRLGAKVYGRSKNVVSITLLALSWASFGLATVLLGTGSSMNRGQAYVEGWLDGECYLVKTGVYVSAAMLTVVNVIFLLGFIYLTRTAITRRRTSPADIHGKKGTGTKLTDQPQTSMNIASGSWP